MTVANEGEEEVLYPLGFSQGLQKEINPCSEKRQRHSLWDLVLAVRVQIFPDENKVVADSSQPRDEEDRLGQPEGNLTGHSQETSDNEHHERDDETIKHGE